MRILNICDINDDAKNIYHKELLKYFEDQQIDSVKYDPKDNPGEFLLDLIRVNYDLVVGHGFGGLLALIVGRTTGARTILINPMYPASRYWSVFLPDYEYQAFIQHMTDHEISCDINGMTTKNIFLLLGKDDDLIDTATTDKYFTKGNSFYVAGGHWPSEGDLALDFRELIGGLITTGDCSADRAGIKEQEILSALSEFFQVNEKCRLFYLFAYMEKSERLTKACVNYMRSIEESDGLKCRYITADTLPTGPEVREHFKDLDLLIVDKIVEIVLSDEIRRSLWIACDEVTGHGGRVLLLSDSHAADLFENDKELMDLIYTGIIREFCVYGYTTRSGLQVSLESTGDDTRPFEDYYRTVFIDDIKTQYGNVAIKWHSPDLDDRVLYMYCKDGQWFYDGGDGWCSSSQAKAVLRAAVDKFVEGAKETDHDAHYFFGWVW